jgi:dTDP-4-amino-4,6-dideoxygalactose transaminase
MKSRKVEFYKHNLSSKDKKAALEVLHSLFLTTGKTVKEFEEKFAQFTENKYAVGLTSCTDALFLSLKYFDIKPGDEVITTPLTFIASANVIEYCGAKQVLIDVENTTGNIDITKVEKAITKKTKAIIPVHLYGHMVDMKKLSQLTKEYNIKIVEDAAHCVEGERDGIKPGGLADIACFSFYATKNMTSGEGGAIVTNNSQIYDWFIKARLHGMSKTAADRYQKYQHYDMEFLGYKANMTNLQAALLYNQLDRAEKNLKKREQIAKKYYRGFANNPAISMPQVLENTKHARHLFNIWVDPKKRDDYLIALQENGVGVSVAFNPLHLMTYYKKKYGFKKGDFPVAERIAEATITLPFYPKLTPDEIDYVITTVNRIII